MNHLPKGSLLLCITSQLDQKLVDSLVIKSKQDLQIALYSIISKNDYTSFHQSLIESLRMHRISVQILSEDDLKKSAMGGECISMRIAKEKKNQYLRSLS